MPFCLNYTCKKCNAISYLGDSHGYIGDNPIRSREEEIDRNSSAISEKQKNCKHEWEVDNPSLHNILLDPIKKIFE